MYLSIECRTITNSYAAIVLETAPAEPASASSKPADANSLIEAPRVNSPESRVDIDSHEPEADETDTDYVTASESESSDSDNEDDEDEESRRQDREARSAERQRVLEAAGLIIKQEAQPPPRPARRTSTRRTSRRRRPAPAVPDRSPRLPSSPHKELPPVPDTESPNNSLRLDDAYERYEAFRQSHLSTNRLSIASVESSSSPTSASFVSMTPTVSDPGEVTRSQSHSSFLHFFGRRTPANDGEQPSTRPTISAPILQREPSPSPEADAAFGSVGHTDSTCRTVFSDRVVFQSWASLVDKSALEGIPTGERRRQEVSEPSHHILSQKLTGHKAIFELIVTEGAYVRDLQLIVEVRTVR